MASPHAESRRRGEASAGVQLGSSREETPRTAKAINAFQISVGLHCENHPEQSLEQARGIILNWATKTLGAPADLASRGDADIKGEQLDVETFSAEDGNVWGCRIEAHPTNMVWRTVHEIELIVRPAGADLNYRQTIHKYPGPEHRAPRQVPSFVREIAREIGLLDGLRLIDGNAWIIENEVDLEAFYEFLTSGDRKLPVYMVTETHRSNGSFNTLIDFETLAESCIGLAHVALMTYQMGYEWTERVGKWLSAYLGTVRTYQPATPLDEANKHRHPLAMPDRIVNWEQEGMSGPPAFAKFLELQAMQASASPQNWRERFVPLSAIKAKELANEVGFSEDAHWKDLERRLQRKVELLESRIIEMSQEAITREGEIAKLKAENAQLASKIYQMEKRPGGGTLRLPASGEERGDALVASVKRLASRLMLIEPAMESAVTLAEDRGLVEMLELLAGKVLESFLRGEDPSQSRGVRDALRAASVTLQPLAGVQFEASSEAFSFHDEQLGEEFMARWEMARSKPGGGRSYIYFDYDGNRQKIVVVQLPGPIGEFA